MIEYVSMPLFLSSETMAPIGEFTRLLMNSSSKCDDNIGMASDQYKLF